MKHICRSSRRGAGKYKTFCGESLKEADGWADGGPFDCDEKTSERDISGATCEECLVEFLEYAHREAKDLNSKINEARDLLTLAFTNSEHFEEFAAAATAQLGDK